MTEVYYSFASCYGNGHMLDPTIIIIPVVTLDLTNVEKEIVEAAPNKGLLGREFKKDAKAIAESLSKMDKDSLNSLEAAMKDNGSVQSSTIFTHVMYHFCKHY